MRVGESGGSVKPPTGSTSSPSESVSAPPPAPDRHAEEPKHGERWRGGRVGKPDARLRRRTPAAALVTGRRVDASGCRRPEATLESSCRSDPRGYVDALPGPPDARAPAPRPSNLATGKALPLLLSVLFLAHAFLREARQERPLVPPTLPWQVELSEAPPPAPPLLRRRPHNKTHFPLHRLSWET